MQKRIVSVLMTLILVVTLMGPCLNVSTYAYSFQSGKDIVNYINKYIRDYYNTNYDYYPEKLDGKTINYNQVWKEWNRNSDGSGSYLLNPVVYGSNHVVKYTNIWNGYEQNAIGYDKFGNSIIPYTENFVNPYDGFFRWDSGWTGHKLNNVSASYWEPYNSKCSNRTAAEKAAIKETRYSGAFIPDANLMEEAIQKGVDYVWTNVPAEKVTTKQYYNGTYIYDRVIHEKGDKPAKGKWTDYLLIVVPPTDISWGLAWRFNGSGNTWFIIDIPIAPFNMVGTDMVTEYEEYASSATPGQRVSFIASVSSDTDQNNVSYSWSVKDVHGNPVSNVSYSGNSYASTGTFNVKKSRSSRHKVTFTMPENDVVVSFVANGDKRIQEMDYDNNRASIDPVTVKVKKEEPAVNVGIFELDYDIYARTVQANTGNMTADFPAGKNYIGSGVASYYAWSPYNNLLRYVSISGETTVNRAPFTTNPTLTTTIYRDALGDYPAGRVWKPNGQYAGSEIIKASGSAWRKYRYSYTTAKGETRSATATHYEAFPTKNAEITGIINVYNGTPTLGSPVITPKVANSHLEWQSAPIYFNVYREMFHMDLWGQRTAKIDVPGQYTRAFVGKNQADIVWAKEVPLANAYSADRATAKKRGQNYNLAVFSTGKEFDKVDYPVKSGYMFNPAATYVCTVKSSVYCDKDATEEEKLRLHKELVDKVTNSFVYNNELMYTVSGNDEYYFKNITNSNKGGILKINNTVNNSYTNGITTAEYEPFMEGYASSGTQSSLDNYRYREFLVTPEVHRIDSETVIKFTVSSSTKRYTNVKMKDGSYQITAKSNPFSFQGLTVPAQNLSDSITVKVKGSVFDDRN